MLKQKVNDVLVILRALWFMLALLALAAVAFIFVQQGQDMINAIMDDLRFEMANELPYKVITLLLAQLALFFWSIQTGFGSRILLLVSDISFYPGNNNGTSQEAIDDFNAKVELWVQQRKRFANRLPVVLSIVPSAIMLLAYTRAFFTYEVALASSYMACIILTMITGFFSYWAVQYWLRNKVAKWHAGNINQQKAFNSLRQISSLKEVGKVRSAFWVMIGVAVAILLIYCFAGITYYQYVGALHLITVGFGVWVAIAWWVDYIDKKTSLFIKPILFGFVCLVSYFNNDHPIRIKSDEYHEPKQNIVGKFDDWFAQSNFDTTKQVPVFFVSAEGGASRSGYWTAQVLSRLADTSEKFEKHIFSFSTVSGGTLGANLFNCLYRYRQQKSTTKTYQQMTEEFFSEDFLAPETGTMVFGELFNLLSFNMISQFDRAGALEKAWEHSWRDHIDENDNLMESSFSKVNQDGKVALINSTEVETGKRAILSNVNIDARFIDAVNLQEKIQGDVRYSTAILLSARFPYLSPAAKTPQEETSKEQRRHFVDGGYFENMGNLTTMDAIRAIKQESKWGKKVMPVIVLITNNKAGAKTPLLLFGNELLEPPTTILSVRSGHTHHVLAQTKQFITNPEIGGTLIQFNMPLNGEDVPMNWFISENAKSKIRSLFTDTAYYNRVAAIEQLLN